MKKGTPRKKETKPRKNRNEAFSADQFESLAKEIQELAGEMSGHAAALRAMPRAAQPASVKIDGAQKAREGITLIRDFSLRAQFKLGLAEINSD